MYLCAYLEVNSDGVFYLSAVLFSAAFPLFQNLFIPPGFFLYACIVLVSANFVATSIV